MNPTIIFFFLHSVVATLILGVVFMTRSKDGIFKNFGKAMILDAAAFAIWAFGLIKPEIFQACVTLGNACFLVSLVFMLYVPVQKVQKTSLRQILMVVGAIVAAWIFYMGYVLAPGHNSYISPEGLLFFNGGAISQMLYIFALMIAGLPAVDLLASKFKSYYSSLVRYIFIIEVVGGIILITSKDLQALYIAGWIMGLAYLVLWTSLLFSKKAWASIS